MKTQEERIKIFESTVKNTRFEQLSISSDIGQGIIMGYTQCQEDMADKKYTEEDMRQAMICVIVSNSIKNSQDITEYIASINKQ
tara:strand:+ start:191 stop:442 length:252 start_codon:yes stop_codon:yes gene_type:complete